MLKIRKVAVTTGVYWVEIPEAGCHILCGCPADSVKHLMKRGLIVTREDNGVVFETGPNAILLSDVMLQNGQFANLAEFPVLQMLYRQGMILPNHPNNTGKKPMLIGSREQVEAQMRYIYRGNYGLVSKEEILEQGVSRAQADEMMRMKLKFAFGAIRETSELLDARVVESEAVEIHSSVFVRRREVNIFEILYQGESVTVNLNLDLTQKYESPYPLGFYEIPREFFGVIHSGEGDGWDPDRPSMSSILMYQGKLYLIDAGPNLLSSLMALGIGIGEVEGLFHTHAHDDHFAGITTLIRAGHRIKYYATPLVRASVAKKLSALLSFDEDEFDAYFDTRDLKFDSWNDVEGLEVKPLFSPHPLETNIFLFRTPSSEGYTTYAHLADIVSLGVLKKMVGTTDGDGGISRVFYDRTVKRYLQMADLKKIDIGGGLIHGEPEDFRDDQSKKIVMAHTSQPLTGRQREIGSSAAFGTSDVLIPDRTDLLRRNAFEYVRSYFADSPRDQLRNLLNNEIVTFNPGSIIIKEGDKNRDILLILTGTVECIQTKMELFTSLSAGGMVGEMSCLYHLPSAMTYRAASFVRALRIPGKLYYGFVKKNNFYAQIERLQEGRAFLDQTCLFGEAIPYVKQTAIADAMRVQQLEEGEVALADGDPTLNLVKLGSLERIFGNDVFDRLAERDFFGEESAIFQMPTPYDIRALEPTLIYRIPSELLLDIPIVRWKLFEVAERRRRMMQQFIDRRKTG